MCIYNFKFKQKNMTLEGTTSKTDLVQNKDFVKLLQRTRKI